MKKPLKLLLGIASLWPLINLGLISTFFFYMFVNLVKHGVPEISEIPVGFIIAFGLNLFSTLLFFVLLIIFLINVLGNDRVEKEKKIIWALLIIFGSIVAMPVYWYLFIWSEPKKTDIG